MQEFCHRCGGELPVGDSPTTGGTSAFCPHCGAPQLLLSDYTEPLSTGTEAALAAGTSTGALPPPRPNPIDWRTALGAAAFVAAIGAVLSAIAAAVPGVLFLSTVWTISASLTTLALYQRRRPLALMNAGVGVKIGILVGVLVAFFLGGTLSAGMALARFGLHNMAGFDADTAQAFSTLKARMNEVAASRPGTPPISLPIDTLEFRTAMSLLGYGMGLLGILLVSTLGGALGGLLRTRRLSPKV
jgi:hypothetical protein